LSLAWAYFVSGMIITSAASVLLPVIRRRGTP
jgi:hypothetical protein